MAVLINLFCSWICWKFAKEAFLEERNFVGWLGVVISAANFAAALNQMV